MSARQKLAKVVNLIGSERRFESARGLLEIHLNRRLFDHRPAKDHTVAFETFLDQIGTTHKALAELLKSGGEAELAVSEVRAAFASVARKGELPFPITFNADISFAKLCYGLTRHLACERALEIGIGYGITSAVVLSAMERNERGRLVSLDLPSLADPSGRYIGLAVPSRLKAKWTMHLGGSRSRLRNLLDEIGSLDLFISDSANVFTLQRYEFETAWPSVRPGGFAIFNNVGAKFQAFLRSVAHGRLHGVWQVEKTACATGLIEKIG